MNGSLRELKKPDETVRQPRKKHLTAKLTLNWKTNYHDHMHFD